MNFEYFPWGNAYFVTSKCKGAGAYDILSRRCFDTVCGAGAAARPPDCFGGPLVCQNGQGECLADRYIACAKRVANRQALRYMPFVVCLDAPFQANPRLAAADVQASAAACAASVGLDFTAVSACTAGAEGDGEVRAQAMATPSHPFCPYVLVDGKELQDKDTLLSAVCAAFHELPLPQGCPPPGTYV